MLEGYQRRNKDAREQIPNSPWSSSADQASSFPLTAGESSCRVDVWWLAEQSEGSADEEPLSNELSESDGRHWHAVPGRNQAEQDKGDHRNQDLQADGVVGVTDEAPNVEMLLDSAIQRNSSSNHIAAAKVPLSSTPMHRSVHASFMMTPAIVT